jgi:hypothetical protein
MRYQILLLCLLLPACSVLQPRNVPLDIAAHCETVDCVIDKVDSIANNPQYGGSRWTFMEGYKDTNLKSMYNSGRLTINTVNPIVAILFGVYGYTSFERGLYGEMYSCEVNYCPGFNWLVLVHELTHCQGYQDYGSLAAYLGPIGYTEEQQKIIKEEDVDLWVNTTFYKENKYLTPDYIYR